MTEHLNHVAGGAIQAVSDDLTKRVLQTPQGQQAMQVTANTIAQTGAAVVGTVATAGQAATAIAGAVVAGGTIAVTAAAPVVVVAAAGYGLYRFCKWLAS